MQEYIFKGINFGFYARNGYFSSEEARNEVDKIAALNVEWICLIVTVMQESYYSTRMFRDFMNTPSDMEVFEIIEYIHSKGIKVMLRPMIECWDGTQRGQIVQPDDMVIFLDRPVTYRKDWFDNYGLLTKHYCSIAEKAHCEAYGLDSELQNLAHLTDYWNGIIHIARNTYSGHLTSSLGNPAIIVKLLEEDKKHWIFQLDSFGISFYFDAASEGGATVESMVDFFETHVYDYMRMSAKECCRHFAEIYKKPFYFGEIGCCSVACGAKVPWFWNNGGGYDGQEQANYLEAVIRSFGKESWWNGLFWWKWDEQNKHIRPELYEDPKGDKGFTIDGKPAAQIMKSWKCKRGNNN